MLKLLKAAYGLRDAPRAWRIRLDLELKKLGGIPLPTDKSLYCFFSKANELEALVSTHVDDLKGGGTPARTKAILEGLERSFGKLKTQHDNFTHCGIVHEKTADGYIMHQNHYAQQLVCIDTSSLNVHKLDEPLSEEFVSKFMSLLGGLSWLIQTRADICVYVTALQRIASKATVGHALKINKLTKWVRRKKCHLSYKRMTGNIQLACVSDSAFKTEPNSSIALRGAIIGIWSEDGTFHVLEYYCRKQRRICRSTFAAETNALADAVEIARLLNFTITHTHQQLTPQQLIALEEQGKLPVQLHCYVDCKSLFDTLSAADLHTPTEASLVLIVAVLRELIEQGIINKVSWIQTTDMLADGLTKGLVSRKALLHTCMNGIWAIEKEFKTHQFAMPKPVTTLYSASKLIRWIVQRSE